MLLALLIVNNFGKPRLLKFYRHTPEQKQQQIVRELFSTLTVRSEASSSFVDASAWFGVPGARIIYRQYATLYFCIAIDSSESELGILDLIQVLVETLDRHFKNVCELDIIFNSERVHFVVDEMIVGGLVVETNPSEILEAIDAQGKLERSQSEAGEAAAAVQNRLDALAGSLGALQNRVSNM